ncbi:MAG: hypothetical protein ABSH33_20545, partial [Steroidobacteraceae bacterium]
MNSMLKTGGTLCALALGLASILRPAHAANDAPVPAAGASDAAAVSALAGQDTDAAVDPQSAALHSWRKLMTQNPAPVEGCFHASYPNVTWDRVECKAAQPGVHPVHVKP